MTAGNANSAVPLDGNYKPILGTVVSPGTGLVLPQGGKDILTDSITGQQYAPTLVSPVDGTKATYTYAVTATAPYTSPTDWIVIRGSASKTIKIVRFEFSAAATAATSDVVVVLKKHTIANTAGTSSNPTPVKHDSNDGAAGATVLLYTVAPTIDATAAVWKTIRWGATTVAQAAYAAASPFVSAYIWSQGMDPFEGLTLRGVAQEFAVNLGGTSAPAGGVYDVAISWTEE